MSTSKTVEEIADLMASDADEHYRFSSATRKQVAKTALMDVLADLVPLKPLLLNIHEEGRCTDEERKHLGELLDTLTR